MQINQFDRVMNTIHKQWWPHMFVFFSQSRRVNCNLC